MWKSRLLCLDPGGTTGVALLEYDEETPPSIIWQKQIEGGLHGFLNFHWDQLQDWLYSEIICESFTLREGVYGVDLSPTYIIGALEALHESDDIIYQEPSMKPLCDDERLKKMGLYVPGRGHAMDAVRHGVIYLRNKKHKPTLEAGWKE
jgi:hypothetical protein